MPGTIDTGLAAAAGPPEGISSSPASRPSRPAAAAAERVWAAGIVLGASGLALSVFVIGRLFLTWRVTPHAASHQISLLGQRLSYPVANVDALIVLALAVAGLAVGALTAWGAIRELAATRTFERYLAARSPRPWKGALVIDDERPQAFCAGLFNPRVYVSSGAVASLDETALDAVLAHEAHHARRRDPLRLAVGRVLARALFFVPGLAELVHRQQNLAELGADENAMNIGPDSHSALARAMLTFSESSPTDGSVGIDPGRVDHLLGEPPNWRFPTLLCLAAAVAIGLLGTIAVLAGQLAAGSATLAPPFLSHQPCVVILALIPVVVVLGCAGSARFLRRNTV
jgi:Zn-dependent protease with chaperone function